MHAISFPRTMLSHSIFSHNLAIHCRLTNSIEINVPHEHRPMQSAFSPSGYPGMHRARPQQRPASLSFHVSPASPRHCILSFHSSGMRPAGILNAHRSPCSISRLSSGKEFMGTAHVQSPTLLLSSSLSPSQLGQQHMHRSEIPGRQRNCRAYSTQAKQSQARTTNPSMQGARSAVAYESLSTSVSPAVTTPLSPSPFHPQRDFAVTCLGFVACAVSE